MTSTSVTLCILASYFVISVASVG